MAKTETVKVAKPKVVSQTNIDLKAARALLKETRELVKNLAEKSKTERETAKVAKTEARTKRIADRKAKLEAALKKLEATGKVKGGPKDKKKESRKPGPVQVIKPAE